MTEKGSQEVMLKIPQSLFTLNNNQSDSVTSRHRSDCNPSCDDSHGS